MDEIKKIHSNFRRTHSVLSIINTCTYPFLVISLYKFICISNKSFLQAPLCPTKSEFQVVSIISGFLRKKKKEAIFLPSKQFYNTLSKMHKSFSLSKKGAGLLCCSSEQGIFHSNDGEEYFISGISHKEQAWLGSLF